ncbi:ACT domain-containing protein [Nitratireductor sp. GISD-1A_MAKvit]|uniref:ACT domain-containing protein n=1 Tax=Nitratireductor sp. GISD-1A_MAKvit TaxID=3234198 RepID=UPI0034658505
MKRKARRWCFPSSGADALGFDTEMPMRRITLNVFSALDGVGLTAGVATALAEKNIPCNVIAAFHHDHVFVPEKLADMALSVLQDVQTRAQSNGADG